MPVSPPRPKMPPLNSLRAFEAAARLNGISAAADELCVTPAAVAQQIKSLEIWAGEKLFKRNAQGVELTTLGANILADFNTAFDALAAAVQKLRVSANPHEIRIAAMPSIAQLWVSPRLPAIRNEMPNVSISVTAMEQPPNLLREPFDLAIFYEENTAVSDAIIIGRDTIYPVCSPDIAARLNTIDDLKNETFLHDTAWKNDWETWLSVASPDQNLTKSGPEFSLYSLALEECKNGAGILIGHDALVQPQLNAGTLVAPFKIKVDLPMCLTIRPLGPFESNSSLEVIVSMLAESNA
ncbi:MAG: LysR substrate-binding domain-containing protein [Roseibium sp.]